MDTSHRKTAQQSAPCCLLCNQPLQFVEGADFPDGLERALECDQHPTVVAATGPLSDAYAASDDYVRRLAEISTRIRGQSVQAAWYTTQWFSLLLELNSGDLLLIYPIWQRAAIEHIPRDICAPDAPKGLVPLRAEGLIEISGRWDQGKPKPGLRGVVAAMQLGLPIENIGVVRAGRSEDSIEISFAGYYKLEVSGEGYGGGCFEWCEERCADDLSLEWFSGREPQLIAMC